VVKYRHPPTCDIEDVHGHDPRDGDIQNESHATPGGVRRRRPEREADGLDAESPSTPTWPIMSVTVTVSRLPEVTAREKDSETYPALLTCTK
jgi:hypothetical protein